MDCEYLKNNFVCPQSGWRWSTQLQLLPHFFGEGLFSCCDNFCPYLRSILIGQKQRLVYWCVVQKMAQADDNNIIDEFIGDDSVCSRCDGNHKDYNCPHFRMPRESHQDAARNQLWSNLGVKKIDMEFVYDDTAPQPVS